MPNKLASAPRSLATLVLISVVLVIFCIYSYLTYSPYAFSTSTQYTFAPSTQSCSPQAYADGKWVARAPRTNKTHISDPKDALEFAGFQGCASSREYNWHIGSDGEDQWNRFEHPGVMDWEWQVPEDRCQMEPLEGEKLLRHLIEDGGWLLLGDSVTENHFFSLSCVLYPHVIATPDYVANPYFHRAWPQNLYLNPSSPLIPALEPHFPPGFSIAHTALVTFRRVDLLLEASDIARIHWDDEYQKGFGEGKWSSEFALFSDERAWTLGPEYYMELFFAQAPLRYSTLVASTGGHWTTTLLNGLHNESAPGNGIESVLDLFKKSMMLWANKVQGAMDEKGVVEKRGNGDIVRRKVVVRAYLPGHENCHEKNGPWEEYVPFTREWYNWNWIGDMNRIFESVVQQYRDIHFLPIDRPALLRPDTHANGDCLHLISGPGVLEGWTHYIWHYVSQEIPRHIIARRR